MMPTLAPAPELALGATNAQDLATQIRHQQAQTQYNSSNNLLTPHRHCRSRNRSRSRSQPKSRHRKSSRTDLHQHYTSFDPDSQHNIHQTETQAQGCTRSARDETPTTKEARGKTRLPHHSRYKQRCLTNNQSTYALIVLLTLLSLQGLHTPFKSLPEHRTTTYLLPNFHFLLTLDLYLHPTDYLPKQQTAEPQIWSSPCRQSRVTSEIPRERQLRHNRARINSTCTNNVTYTATHEAPPSTHMYPPTHMYYINSTLTSQLVLHPPTLLHIHTHSTQTHSNRKPHKAPHAESCTWFTQESRENDRRLLDAEPPQQHHSKHTAKTIHIHTTTEEKNTQTPPSSQNLNHTNAHRARHTPTADTPTKRRSPPSPTNQLNHWSKPRLAQHRSHPNTPYTQYSPPTTLAPPAGAHTNSKQNHPSNTLTPPPPSSHVYLFALGDYKHNDRLSPASSSVIFVSCSPFR